MPRWSDVAGSSGFRPRLRFGLVLLAVLSGPLKNLTGADERQFKDLADNLFVEKSAPQSAAGCRQKSALARRA